MLYSRQSAVDLRMAYISYQSYTLDLVHADPADRLRRSSRPFGRGHQPFLETGRMPSRLPLIIHRLVRSRRGVTVIEYAVLAASISIAAVAALGTVGQTIQNLLAPASSAMS